MKKVVLYSLSVILIAGASISCRKTSKGKMSNEWELESWSESNTSTNDNGDKWVIIKTSNGSNYIETDSYTENGEPTVTETETGTLNEFSFEINKEGKWSRNFGYTVVEDEGNSTKTTIYNVLEEGTWNFLGKVDEFKKNERVVFNMTSSTTSESVSVTTGDITVTDNSSSKNTYADGEMANVMLVVESSRKELELKSETDRSWTYSDSGNTDSGESFGETVFTLVQP